MVDRFRISTGDSRLQTRLISPQVMAVGLSGFLVFSTGETLMGQTPSAAAYPSSPTAAAGMTSGLPAGSTSDQARMAQIRTQAQSAQGQAVAASMARSADQALENQHTQRTLQDAREIKFLKRDMAERMKWERSNQAQVNKVSTNDMSSWQTPNGNVKVERDVPDPFLQAMIAMEGQEKPPKKERKGFSGLNPFKKEEPDPMEGMEVLQQPLPGLTTPAPAPQASTASAASRSVTNPDFSDYSEQGGGGFFSNLKVPKIGNKNKAQDAVDSGQVYDAEPQFTAASGGGSNAAYSPPTEQTNTVVPARSGNALIDGSAESVGTVSFTDDVPKEKKGLFSGFKKSEPEVVNASFATPSSRSGGGFMGFGKKKAEPGIDAGLFPDEAVSQTPTGGSLAGGYTVEDVAEDASFAPSSTGDIVMPGEAPKRKGFSLSMPDISVPSVSLGGLGKSDDNGGGRNVPTLTTINSAGTDYYMVTSTAQFMVYGNDQMSSEVRALSSGTLVRMTKPGEQWASVRLPDGSEGVIQNKFLRAASAAEAGGQFAAPGGE